MRSRSDRGWPSTPASFSAGMSGGGGGGGAPSRFASSHRPRIVTDERFRSRIAKHALHLLLQRRGIVQLSASRRLPQLVVRNAAPEKERQPRRQIEIAEAIGGACRQACGLAFHAEQETRSSQNPLDPALDAGVKAVFGLP